MDTIDISIPEKYYWRIVQGLAAAGTASYRHGMERHAEEYHEAEKYLFQGYEQHREQEEREYTVRVYDGSVEVNTITATSGTLENTVREVLRNYPDREIRIGGGDE